MAQFQFNVNGKAFIKMFRDAVSTAFLCMYDDFSELDEICNTRGIQIQDDEADEE